MEVRIMSDLTEETILKEGESLMTDYQFKRYEEERDKREALERAAVNCSWTSASCAA